MKILIYNSGGGLGDSIQLFDLIYSLSEKFGSDKGKLIPTDIGMIVTDFLTNHFEYIMDYNLLQGLSKILTVLQRVKKIGQK